MEIRHKLLAIMAAAILSTGCATVETESWQNCAIAGALLGGSAGAFVEGAAEVGIGAVAGGFVGATLCDKTVLDKAGTEPDTDGDGVVDSRDECPNTLQGAMVGKNGCTLTITEMYMVMPEEGGKAGTVDVTLNDGREVVLHGEFSALNVAGSQSEEFTSNDKEMKEVFGKVVAALPGAPFAANLYFITNTDKLTPASAKKAEKIFKNIVQRQSVEVLISGHTDTVGSSASNVELSNKRAKMIRKNLIKKGVTAKTIKISGHGEAVLVVKTGDEVDEQKNRRVEISVR